MAWILQESGHCINTSLFDMFTLFFYSIFSSYLILHYFLSYYITHRPRRIAQVVRAGGTCGMGRGDPGFDPWRVQFIFPMYKKKLLIHAFIKVKSPVVVWPS